MKRYSCNECDKSYDIYSSYFSHKATHKPPKIRCVKCDSIFYTRGQLYKHCFNDHETNRTVVETNRVPVETNRLPVETKRNTLSSRLFELG